MTTIMKVNSLIIILLFMVSNVIAQSQCDWTVIIDNQVEPPCNPTQKMCVEYDETLVDYYTNLNECEDVCFRVTLTYPKKANLFIEADNGYYVEFPNTNYAGAIICFGQNSGMPLDLPFDELQEIKGGELFYKSAASVCTVMIEP